jgi:hypothetical protein
MGAPASALLVETFSQYMEYHKICTVLHTNHITGYYTYIDDILIIYNINNTDIDKTFADFNNVVSS